MIKIDNLEFNTVEDKYSYMNKILTSYICDDDFYITSLSNASAILWMFLENINWSGFYLYRNDELVLGPFQGKPACTRIMIGKGVCGTAAQNLETALVYNVHEFEGHIACDSASNSEIVIPLIQNGRLIGVMDIDSPSIGRFDETDKKYLEEFAEILCKYIKFPENF